MQKIQKWDQYIVPAPPMRVATRTSAARWGVPRLGFTNPKFTANREPEKEDKIEAKVKPITCHVNVPYPRNRIFRSFPLTARNDAPRTD